MARVGEALFKKFTAKVVFRLVQHVTHISIPGNTGGFRLLSWLAPNSLLEMREHHRFMKDLFAWIDYPAVAVTYRCDQRYAGVTKWNYRAIWNLALEGLKSLAIAFLKSAKYLGFAIAMLAFLFAAIVVYKAIQYGNPSAEYRPLVVVILFLGGIRLIATGLLGEYLGRIFNERKRLMCLVWTSWVNKLIDSVRTARL